MKTTVIAMRIDESTSLLIKKLIKYNLADNSADALRFIMLKSLGVAREEVERRRRRQRSCFHDGSKKAFRNFLQTSQCSR